jgi:hypothetical protein
MYHPAAVRIPAVHNTGLKQSISGIHAQVSEPLSMLSCTEKACKLVKPASSSPSCRLLSVHSRHQQVLKAPRSKAVNDQSANMAEGGRGGGKL